MTVAWKQRLTPRGHLTEGGTPQSPLPHPEINSTASIQGAMILNQCLKARNDKCMELWNFSPTPPHPQSTLPLCSSELSENPVTPYWGAKIRCKPDVFGKRGKCFPLTLLMSFSKFMTLFSYLSRTRMLGSPMPLPQFRDPLALAFQALQHAHGP